MPKPRSAINRHALSTAAPRRFCVPPAVEGAFPPVWTAVLTRLGSGAAVPAHEVEPWARAVSLAQMLVQWIDAGLCRCQRSEGGAIGGFVEGAVAPAVLAWLEAASAAGGDAEARQ